MNIFKLLFSIFFLAICVSGFSFDVKLDLVTNLPSGSAMMDDTVQIFLSLVPVPGSLTISGSFYMVMLKPDGKTLYFPDWTEKIQKVDVVIPLETEFDRFEFLEYTAGRGLFTDYGEYTLACGLLRDDQWISNFGLTTFHYVADDWFFHTGGDYHCDVGEEPREPTAADINNDGFNDLIVSNRSNDLSVLINKGNGTFKNQVLYKMGIDPRKAITEDVNNDSFLDIIASNEGGSRGDVSVLMNRGDGSFEKEVRYATGRKPRMTDVVDLNNDGYPATARSRAR